MKIERKELKQAARRDMRENRPSPMKVTLVFLLLTGVVSLLADFVVTNPAANLYQVLYAALNGGGGEAVFSAWRATAASSTMLALFLNILLFLYSAVMSFGYYAYTLRRTDGESAAYGDLLCGFSRVGRIILMQLVIMGFTFVWTLATIVPATMVGAMVMMVVAVIFGENMAGLVIGLCVLYLFIIAATLFASYLTMRYVLAPFVLADCPELGGMAAVRRSRTLMQGRLGEGFKLSLSFLGWQLLGGLIVALVLLALGAALAVAFFASHNSILLAVGACVLVVAGVLAALPFQMWYQSYYCGTFARYYRALAPKTEDLQAQLEADRPEPF